MYNMKRVAAGVHLPTRWLFERAKQPDIEPTTVGLQFPPPSASTRYSIFTLEWSGARHKGEY